ncbi:MAG: hypothetical protein COT17_06745 [Elusimicrobia bacterium CG08_land_8_20_14_0_20_51_18]|nr:MAG: hypothetical protein COT17_06745 [Elusimicrobia bacterium CG08_land_8_20_14_0_20_51_18]
MKTKNLFFILFLSIYSIFNLSSSLFTQTTARSREMEQAIRLYQEGKDNDAMDRFMDILVKGSPSEKSLANEYISKITLRMNTGVNTVEDKGADSSVHDVEPDERAPGEKNYKTEKYIERGELKETDPEDSREMIGSKVYKKIEEMRRDVLLSISKLKAFKVYMAGQTTPVGVLVNNDEIFSSATNFKTQAMDNLQMLSSLIFTMGKANVMIIPKGGVAGEIEISNIRRAIAINSYLISRGISPSRLYVNLTGSNVLLPKEVTGFDGTLCLLDYKKEPALKSDSDPRTKGPKVSMGIYPTSISVQKNEGAIIEFSVFEGAGGLPSWKFQIYRILADNSMLPIQDLSGEGPKYNQTFFNGREKFFGAPYPWGKYVFSVSARDLDGKETVEKRLLFIKPTPEEEKKQSGKTQVGKKMAPASGVKKPAAKRGKTLLSKPSKYAKSKRAVKKSRPAETVSAADDSGEEPENQGRVTYKIYFAPGTLEITPNSEKKLEQLSSTLESYPDTGINITGYSFKDEENNKVMARKRADAVKKELVEKYGVDEAKIKSSTYISRTLKTIVEIKLAQE